MKKILLVLTIISLLFSFPLIFSTQSYSQETRATFWEFQSVDTMKYSRDLSREKLNDPSFDWVIETQVRNIAEVGATHVALATPYDEEFLPILKRWVKAARKHNLKIWFRGNWSGWEKWFDYPPIDRAAHMDKTRNFILKNYDLFEDGDIFSACPECENGGPGDPRKNGDVAGHRKFLLDEYQITKNAFKKINKKVQSNYNSMNADVARLVMDKETTHEMDAVVVIDHYVSRPEQLAQDVAQIAQASGGKVILGEFGAPIENINGEMNEDEQAEWISKALEKLVLTPELGGLSYWTDVGGSTELWNKDGKAKKAVAVIKKIYRPSQLTGRVLDELGDPISNVEIKGLEREVKTDRNGYFQIPYLNTDQTFKVDIPGYKKFELKINTSKPTINIVLQKEHEDLLFKIKRFLKRFLP